MPAHLPFYFADFETRELSLKESLLILLVFLDGLLWSEDLLEKISEAVLFGQPIILLLADIHPLDTFSASSEMVIRRTPDLKLLTIQVLEIAPVLIAFLSQVAPSFL